MSRSACALVVWCRVTWAGYSQTRHKLNDNEGPNPTRTPGREERRREGGTGDGMKLHELVSRSSGGYNR